jgi:valyl-tRNA synthetase
MSKSTGNVVVPTDLLASKGSDAVRYWASSARLGVDTIFDDRQMQIGRRLAIKILNASKFVLSHLDGAEAVNPLQVNPLDASMLADLANVVNDATSAHDNYEHAHALERTEQFFWGFCDNYLELVKNRAYSEGPDATSAQYALSVALSVVLRLFAPFLPFVTEEVWSWWHDGSVHRAQWPSSEECGGAIADPMVLADVARVLGEVRRAKTTAKQSMRATAQRVRVSAPAALIANLELGRSDLIDAGVISELELTPTDDGELHVDVELAQPIERVDG